MRNMTREEGCVSAHEAEVNATSRPCAEGQFTHEEGTTSNNNNGASK